MAYDIYGTKSQLKRIKIVFTKEQQWDETPMVIHSVERVEVGEVGVRM